jgi:hypothetical protein
VLAAQLVLGDVDISPIAPPGASAGLTAGSMDGEVQFKLDSVAVESLTQTLERPLFWLTRRPKPADIVSAPANPPGLDLRLVGVMQGDTGKLRALIVSPQQPNGRWLEEGSDVEGWRLTRIGSNAISLEAGGRRHELRMN